MTSGPVSPLADAGGGEAPPPPAHAAARPIPTWRRFGPMIFALMLAAVLVVLIPLRWTGWSVDGRWQSTDDAQVRGDLTPLAARVSGYVRRAPPADYLPVRKGDVLVEIADEDFRAHVAEAVADVDAAQAALDNNRAQQVLQAAIIDAAGAVVAGNRADVERDALQARRQHTLVATQSVAQQDVEAADAALLRAQATTRQAEAQVETQVRQVGVLKSQARQLTAALEARKAALQLAQINLGYTRIAAPANGTAGERLVHAGQLVSAGTQVISVTPSNDVWVAANFKETQLAHMRPGQPASVRVDALPGRRFTGRVAAISPATGSQFALLPPDNASGNYTKVVQRAPVRIVLDAPADMRTRLRPGLSVVVRVDTASRR